MKQNVKKGSQLVTDESKSFTFLVSVNTPVLLTEPSPGGSFVVLDRKNCCNWGCHVNNKLTWRTSGVAELFLLQFSRSWLLKLTRADHSVYRQLQSLEESNAPLWTKPAKAGGAIREQLFAMTQELSALKPANGLLLLSKAYDVIAHLFLQMAMPVEKKAPLREKEVQIASKAKNYLDKLPDRVEFTIISLAKELNSNETTLKNAFKKLTGTTIHKYYHQLRMNKAEKLLREGKTITETSRLIGYKHVSHFSHVFKQLHGRPPAEIYR